jgi:UDP-2,3-diacylglucosamine hydrolase
VSGGLAGPNRRDRVALICGGGDFPLVAARAAQSRGVEVFLLGLRGVASAAIEDFPHVWLGLGQLGAAFREIFSREIRDVCFIGGLGRPEFSDLRLDWGGIKRLPEIARLFRGGDDHVLKGVIGLFEREGLRVVGVETLAPELLAGVGAMNSVAFPADLAEDLAFGRQCLGALSAFDCGQGLVVAQRRVIAIEAAEGTDAMLARVADLRTNRRWRAKGPAGLLVKAPKAGQDLRVDLPAIGPQTIAAAARGGLRGLAVAAGKVLVLDRAELARQADQAGLFLYGFTEAAA